ncbi:MAG TPA: KTSC domain-containing protein [Polyangiales bacterium]|jgi:hypothetical protein|nr:KTSC domain-containing protein [Polyangiales bacterium]
MERQPVESRSLRSVGYESTTRALEIEFQNGRIYTYDGVPREAYEWLMRTRDKGGYFNRMIRDRYATRDVTPAPAGADADLEAQLRESLRSNTDKD